MKTGDIMHSFRVTDKKEVKDLSATAYCLTHASGLRLVYLDREDENKLFSIAFKTYPTDDTGVFHIIEHSVLCGSQKYPVKEPFAELLKSSLKTLLNAYTYKDRTVYPVASRNERDFHNLIEVYLDAVFHPNLLSDENIFMREGHRLEPDGEDCKINGVVYNEMLAGSATAPEVTESELSSLLFPSGTYSFNSGGDPSAIPTLTYEKLKEEYIRHYNPKNAFCVLDGKMDIEKTLGVIDASLIGVGGGEEATDFSLGGNVITEKKTARYQAADGERIKDRSRFCLGYRIAKYYEREKIIAYAALCDTLAGSNTSPLRRKILDTGLCESFHMGVDDSGREATLVVEAKGVKDGREDALWKIYRETLAEYVKKGLSKEEVAASVLSMEFKTREADAGGSPVGFIYASAVYDSWLCGGDPVSNLSYSEIFSSLKEGAGSGYFEELIKQLLTFPEAKLLLLPSLTYEKEREEERREALLRRCAAMSDREKEALRERHGEFLIWQEREDNPDDLAKIPSLSLSDLGDMRAEIPKEMCNINGVDVLFTKMNTRGIVYTDLYFDISDCRYTSELFLLALLFGEMNTARGDANFMRSRIKSRLGSLSLTLSPVMRDGKVRLYLAVKASALNSEKDELINLLGEYIYTGKMPSSRRVAKKIKQLIESLISSINYNSVGAALSRLGAEYDGLSLLGEYWYGISALKEYKRMAENPFSTRRTLRKILRLFKEDYFVKERLTLGITGERDEDFATRLIGSLRQGEAVKEIYKRPLLAKETLGIVIPTPTATVIRGAALEEGESFKAGEQAVFASVLDYEILWNEIRLKGGAYDTGYIAQRSQKFLAVYSSCEPDPTRADGVFRNISEYANAFIEKCDGNSFERYIIGSVGESEPLASPKLDGSFELIKYLAGRTRADEEEKHKEMLAFDKEAFLRSSELLSSVMKRSRAVTVGAREVLEKLPLDRIIEI